MLQDAQEIHNVINQISYRPKMRMEIFRELPPAKKRDAILRLSRHVRLDIVKKLNKEELVGILEHLDTDEATDLIRLLPRKKQTTIIEELNDQLQSDIALLLKFDPATAASVMNMNYILVEADDTLASVTKQVRVHEHRTGKPPAIIVLNSGKIAGYLPGYRLGVGNARDIALKHAQKIKTIKHTARTHEVLDVFRANPHSRMLVLGERGNIMGLIYSDDVLKILREKEAASLYDFAGIDQEETVYDSTKSKIKHRYKWLIINLGTAFLAAFTVGLFDETISKYVLLAVYMPIVAGMGGNAGTQTLAVLVRGISLKQITLATMWRTLKNELGSGLTNGIINGIIIAAVVILMTGNWQIALILAMAMVINLLVAAFFGTLIPLVMKRLKKDPASSATIFITTATDVLGFIAFLGLATLLLP